MKHLDLFSGIGGFALAAQWCWGDRHEVIAFCEQDQWARKVLTKHWPDVPCVEDIHEFKGPAQPVDLLTGGFPCQPFSTAGKRLGNADDRALWGEMLRVIQLFKPRWVIAENVRGILSIQDGLVFEQVCVDLEDAGYEVQPFVVPAVATDAHHRRDRVWFCARYVVDTASPQRKRGVSIGLQEEHNERCLSGNDLADAQRIRRQGQGESVNAINPEAAKAGQAVESFDGCQQREWIIKPGEVEALMGYPVGWSDIAEKD